MRTLARIALIAWSVWTTPAAAVDGDYPYIRAYSLIVMWTKIELDDHLRVARVNNVPQTAVYPEQGQFHGWRLLDTIDSAKFRADIIQLARTQKIR